MEIITLPLKLHNEIVKNVVCIVTKLDVYQNDVRLILSEYELQKYDSFLVESARIKYLLGRCSAKNAYIHITKKNLDVSKIEIRNGIFGNPVLNSKEFDVSISHANGVGVAIIFDKLFPMGIDIEIINVAKISALSVMTTQDEINGCCHQNGEITALTASWCLKEALSKILRTGITIPLELFKMEKFINNGDAFTCDFLNFPQYKGYAKKIKTDIVVAVVYPKQLIIGDVELF